MKGVPQKSAKILNQPTALQETMGRTLLGTRNRDSSLSVVAHTQDADRCLVECQKLFLNQMLSEPHRRDYSGYKHLDNTSTDLRELRIEQWMEVDSKK